MLKFFQICFATGVIFTVVSFVLGQMTHFIGMDTHIDAHAGGGLEGHMDLHIDTHIPILPVSPLKPIVIASFVTVFGGVGIICLQLHYSIVAATLIALAAAFATAVILYTCVVVPLYKAQNTSAVSQRELIGSGAKTTLGIQKNGFGKITYTVNGNTYSAPARSIDGKDIHVGAPVVIIEIKKNTFYVKEIKGGM